MTRSLSKLMREYVDSAVDESPAIHRYIVPITKVKEPMPERLNTWIDIEGRLTKLFAFSDDGMMLPFVEVLLDYEMARSPSSRCRYSIEGSHVTISIPIRDQDSSSFALECSANADMSYRDIVDGYPDYLRDASEQRETELRAIADMHRRIRDETSIGSTEEDTFI